MLCGVCKDINFAPLGSFEHIFTTDNLPPASAIKSNSLGPFYYPHQPSLNAVKASAASGCQFCSQIQFCFPPDSIKYHEIPIDRQVWLDYRLLQDSGLPRAIRASCGNYHGYLDIVKADANQLHNISDPFSDTHTGSQENLKLAKSWVDDCLATHKECQSYREPPFVLPTRVIDVSPSEPLLRTTNGQSGDYAILSHCWGKHPVITTTLGNIEQWRKCIPTLMLSKTFQDAVEVTRSLGLQFLWIDSLCIIQDSKEDWEAESSKMGIYYAYAQICIAATDAPDGSVGCFSARNPFTIQPCSLGVVLNEGTKVSIVSKQVPDHWSKSGPPYLGLSALDQRAWCLQETIMCIRMLKFGRHQLQWACLNKYASESDVGGQEPSVSTQEDFFRALSLLGLQTLLCGPLSKHNIWIDVVEQYTKRQLTQSTDKLPALSGLASQMVEMTQDIYLAGIWKSDLARGLLWRTPNMTHQDAESLKDQRSNYKKSTRPKGYIAPSWSWASVDATNINWDHIREWASIDGENVNADYVEKERRAESLFKLVSAGSELAGLNPYGQVKGGYLEVEGKLKIADVIAWKEGTERQHYDDNLLDPEQEALIGRIDADETDWEARPVHCFPVLRQEPNENGNYDDTSVLCLALVPIEGQKSSYTRVGVLSINDWEWFGNCGVVNVQIL